ncbi:hypothetical protein BO70DRAFT_106090 [Aspergillus heteromorphus CBS 117.55]|uniref:Uncharacterized protein n=1 Tax=Aspergillus heteromorphus CBS 117.55 TaxID=1448321 RepID=A0A317VME8_9EURO|nr:uncharacterized protein BO70DRAFT_106090 [Aspergillus heteromorphus CBS 117.55]PWY74411.1 hypothetical protein BO70DRAFT_106090 [Aspergillus heteromorphus CBS 117.55]
MSRLLVSFFSPGLFSRRCFQLSPPYSVYYLMAGVLFLFFHEIWCSHVGIGMGTDVDDGCMALIMLFFPCITLMAWMAMQSF